ncbi:tetratricopeptide repeat protein [Arsenophonus endosymbiont of Aleurodicus floccissimus]|uniref:tetratricopeptide repeat protein n=1 Tax=Arsenophonus endosymbiont of Aleurodicus floccissimus TaxID=2152761 RepID=UPI000E6B2862|nr:tetratricopeptide repeat protein [Arsenophonus endosymbiont of Aleurodicus floccissimus]
MKVAYYYEKGIGIKKDLTKAAELYLIMVNRGEAEAQYRLAKLYLAGQGINKQPKKSFSLMQKAAQKIQQAKNQLGLFYLYGIRTEKNPQKLVNCFCLRLINKKLIHKII